MLVLASRSPRRRELLAGVGCPFVVDVPAVPEVHTPGERPEAYVQRLSREKAEAVARRRTAGEFVLAADTVVVIDGAVLEKPLDRADAERMIEALSGRTHTVFTGVTLAVAEPAGAVRAVETLCVETDVTFRALSTREIAGYCATPEPYDKAGAYAAQGLGACLIARIDGSYTNVVGLPLAETTALLGRAGVFDPFGDPREPTP